MRKILLSVLVVSLFLLSSYAQQEEENALSLMLAAISQRQQFKAKPQVAFTLQLPLRKLGTQDATKNLFFTVSCQAYALNENWLIAAGTCWDDSATLNLAEPLKIGKLSLPIQNNLFIQPLATPHLILVRVPQGENTKLLTARMADQNRKITLLSFNDQLKLQQGQLFLETAPLDKSSLSFKEGEITLSSAPKQPGTQLILARDKNLYWFGVKQPHSNKKFTVFSTQDTQFVADTLNREDPQAYQHTFLPVW